MGLAIAVVLAVGHIVLFVVADQIIEGKTVVRGHEINRRSGAAVIVCIQVRGTGDTRSELAERGWLAAPEVADSVAVLTVPFSPLWWEVTDLVTALTDIPRLCDELDLADNRILLHQVKEGGEAIHIVEFSSQGGGQIEAEAVDMHLGDPVAK